MICTRQMSFVENMNTRLSNVIDTYCENTHSYAMNHSANNNNEREPPRRRQTRDTYRPMSSIFGTTPIRQNPFSRPRTSILSNNLSNLPRRASQPRVRINTRASTSTNTTPFTFGGTTLNNFINNTLNTSTWSHSIPSAQDISCSTITARWWQMSGSTWTGPEPNNTTCPIRQRRFDENDEIMMITHCKHCFVKASLMQWFQLDSRCPVCRWDIYRSSNSETTNSSTPSFPPPPPPPTTNPPSRIPPPPPPTTSTTTTGTAPIQNIFRDELLLNNAPTETSLPTIPGVDNATQTFLRNVTNHIETGLSNVLRNRGIDMSSNIVEASYTFSLPTPPSRGNVFNEETFHIRQQISPITTDNSNNIVSNEDDDEEDIDV